MDTGKLLVIKGLVFTSALMLCFALISVEVARSQAGSGDRPNIILILTDDQDEASMAHMPNLQEMLVDKGTTFRNFIFNVSLCFPPAPR